MIFRTNIGCRSNRRGERRVPRQTLIKLKTGEIPLTAVCVDLYNTVLSHGRKLARVEALGNS